MHASQRIAVFYFPPLAASNLYLSPSYLPQAEKSPFLSDIEEIRRRARQHIESGAMTQGYKADRETVVRLLNEALATEIVCVLRYKRHYFTASGIHPTAVAEEFLEHANEEQAHADMIAKRIIQLDGEPNLNPEGLLTRSHSQYTEASRWWT